MNRRFSSTPARCSAPRSSQLDEFELREGVKIIRHYNGCGILVGEMKANPTRPDAYFACDLSFMDQVKYLFARPLDISANQLVILVARHNPKDIRTLAELGRAGLRIGLGRQDQSALGATKDLLNRASLLRRGIQERRRRERHRRRPRQPVHREIARCRRRLSQQRRERPRPPRHRASCPQRQRHTALRHRQGIEAQVSHGPASGCPSFAPIAQAIRRPRLRLAVEIGVI